MTVQTDFYNYQANQRGYDWDKPPYEACSPRLILLRGYLNGKWSMDSLGCHMDRTIVGGSSVSSHAFGAALDMSWKDAGRLCLDQQIIPYLIDYSLENGIQAIHDYDGKRIWRPPAYRAEMGQVHSGGWKGQSGGQYVKGNQWLHIEILPERFTDESPIYDPTPTPTPPVGLKTVAVSAEPVVLNPAQRAELKGNADVFLFQRNMAGLHVQTEHPDFDVAVDGDYGPQSQQACRTFQAINNLTADAICGGKTWTAIFNP